MKNSAKSISFDDVLQNKDLSHLHEVVHFLENTKKQDLFPKKQTAYFKEAVKERVHSLFIENPNMTIKDVLTSVLNNFSENLDSTILLKMTKWTVQEWLNLSKFSTFNTNPLQLQNV